jgi:peptidoglycan/xylan/chitin deacetylase (PgdA/CDA1 family)
VSAARVCVTFDNLDDSEDDPERRRWRATLPRITDALAESRLGATFFVEGVNAELHPETLRELAAAGHEVALHGWRHEPWAELDPDRERELLERGVGALEALDLAPAGFRPPGGGLTSASPALLRELGFAYCSPEEQAAAAAAAAGIAVLPFRWSLVDATYYLPRFAGLRERVLGAREVLPPARLREEIDAALARAVRDGGLVVLILHAFLSVPEERFALLRDTLARVRGLVDAGAVRCAPCRDLAAAARS